MYSGVSEMDWKGEVAVSRGVVERAFDLDVDGRQVPGLLWTPEGAEGPRPLVVIGHGASVHKRIEYVLALARRFVRHHGYAVVAIDGPEHGDRGGMDSHLAFAEVWCRPTITDDTVAELHATVAAVRQLDEVGDGPLGYWGLSMGSIFGIPYVASEPRVQAAVLGLLGVSGPTKDRLQADAGRIACPVLFLLQMDDELFAREKVLELFAAVGSTDKRLHAHPGGHGGTPREEFDASEWFLARALAKTVSTVRG
jgi:dienelactone hydrolase